MITVLCLIAMSTQRGDSLPNDLARIQRVDGPASVLPHHFQSQPNTVRSESAIPSATKAFSKSALTAHARNVSTAKTWTGYFTRDGRHEVMSTTWKSPLGQCMWVDNGQMATIRCELVATVDLHEVADAATFIEETVRDLLITPSYSKEKIRHWLKPMEGSPKLWAGIFDRGITYEETKLPSGKTILLHTSDPQWYQHLTVATDGRAITVSFLLKQSQKNPFGDSATANNYKPFRFDRP